MTDANNNLEYELENIGGAAVKLRRLADPEIGIEAGHGQGDAESIRQILAVVERSIAMGGAA